MKIFLVGYNPDKVGGGWSFIDNFKKGNWKIVDNPEDCDIYFITSVSMLDKVSQIPFGEKKVVLRIDNVLKDSNNGRIYGLDGGDKITRMESLKQVAQKADYIIYQSKWAEGYLKPFLGDLVGKQRVIINGSDDELFNPEGGKLPSDYRPVYLYVRSSNHDNKGWHIAWYEFQKIYRENKRAILWIAGRFSPENLEHNFDFFNGENWKYWGYVKDKEMMALLMRSSNYLLFPFFNDACSQTLIEAYLSGLSIKYLAGGLSGGSPEIRNTIQTGGREALSYKVMNRKYWEAFNELL